MFDDPVDWVLLPADHPLAAHPVDRDVTPDELRGVPFGLFARALHPALYDRLRATLAAAGAIEAEAPDAGSAAADLAMAGVATVSAGAPLLIAGGAWTFVPRSVAAARDRGSPAAERRAARRVRRGLARRRRAAPARGAR